MNSELIKAIELIKDYCAKQESCMDCDFGKSFGCDVYKTFGPCSWIISNIVNDELAKNFGDSSAERIAELHREIELRDRKTEELEAQLASKDSIVQKQGVLLTELQETQFKWHSVDEEPAKDGWYLYACVFDTDDVKKNTCVYNAFYFKKSGWKPPFNDYFYHVAWAEIPRYEENENETD